MQKKTVELLRTYRPHAIKALWFVSGFVLALVIFTLSGLVDTSEKELRETSVSKQFPLISPLLSCENSETASEKYLIGLRRALQGAVDTALQSKQSTDISIYYRDLTNGPWLSINEEKKFHPASLLKIPLLMAVLKEYESDNSFIQKKIKFVGSDVVQNQFFPPKEKLVIGNIYTIQDLTDRMIRYSDNDSTRLIAQFLGKEKVSQTYLDTGHEPPPENGDIVVSTKEYATFFRILYNSTYLDKRASETALELLTMSEFKQGLRAGVPEYIPLAHKFGEREITPGKLYQLHDCGVVYLPKRPYLLCVMTQGANSETLAHIIANVSKIAYEQMSKI